MRESREPMTNGADRLLATLEHNDIEVCFANPGTS